MIIGVPKEIKNNENRVAMTPAGVKAFCLAGHKVLIQKSAGLGSGFKDEEYNESGAAIIETAKEVFDKADMIMKVKEPLASEYDLLRADQILFTYFHFASSLELTEAMIKGKVTCITYETVETEDGGLPLLAPMSEVAGKMAAQVAAYYLALPYGGRGVLMGGVPGVSPAKVVVIGGGAVGTNAAKVAAGMGANVTLFDININRLKYLSDVLPKNINLIMSNQQNIEEEIKCADAVIGAVLIPGAKAPKLITEEMIKKMKPNSVIVDVAIDQGGCIATSRPTSHSDPVFKLHGVLHYCVTNMPGAFSRTSTFALTNATLPYGLEIANKGYKEAVKENKALAKGLNVIDGKVTYEPVAKAFDLEYSPLEETI
ncbi:MAG: alanine dehydrogenase [Candidatus Caldatribacteriota bacterium]|nr:alanine dehydrogenase [Candidatus Caldatribacteriota bacterium]